MIKLHHIAYISISAISVKLNIHFIIVIKLHNCFKIIIIKLKKVIIIFVEYLALKSNQIE